VKQDLFAEARREIEAAGLTLLEAHYLPETSGSWHIVVENNPLLRMSWDRESCWLVLEEELPGVLNGPRIWKDIWIGENLDSINIKRGVAILARRCRGEFSEMRRKKP
jgi:hypothetical protein